MTVAKLNALAAILCTCGRASIKGHSHIVVTVVVAAAVALGVHGQRPVDAFTQNYRQVSNANI